ncbi:MAG: Ser/Thr protein kinase RdoA (MazF antagonist) [Candidatus Latescibacterota bacterium]|jgi:Ser/Thr protein kinase RdoA (MazF antagonist)
MAAVEFSFHFSFDQARRQAKDLHRALLANDVRAVERLHTHHPESPVSAQVQLADAQLVVAREHGFESWTKLKRYSENQMLSQSEDLTDGQNQYVNGRPWEEQEVRLRKLADEALAGCGLNPRKMFVAGHMGNFGYSDFALAVVTEGPEPSHLVTVHYPYDHFSLGEVHRQLDSLCAWLLALDRDAELEVQVPIADETGAGCQLFDHRPDGPEAVCTVQRWIKGRDIAKEDEPIDLSPEVMRALGEVLGCIHQHGQAWPRPEGFNRIGINWVEDVEEVARDHWESRKDNNISRDDLALLRRAVEAITDKRKTAGEPWGLTHGDFTPRNCVEDEGCYKPIDFDLCSLTYQFDDIGWCFVEVEQAEMRRAFLEGYCHVAGKPTDFIRLVEGALIAARTRRCAWGGPLPPNLSAECEKYLAGEPFLFLSS